MKPPHKQVAIKKESSIFIFDKNRKVKIQQTDLTKLCSSKSAINDYVISLLVVHLTGNLLLAQTARDRLNLYHYLVRCTRPLLSYQYFYGE